MPVGPALITCGPGVASGSLLNGPPNYHSFGGTRTYSSYSGQAGDAITVWSGAGILNTIYILGRIQSGIQTNVLDAASTAVVSGFDGFRADSGMRVIGVVPPTYDGGMVSGAAIGSTLDALRPFVWGTPFYSGLCFAGRSGQTPFALNFTPLAGPS